jgi:hypothetical protein
MIVISHDLATVLHKWWHGAHAAYPIYATHCYGLCFFVETYGAFQTDMELSALLWQEFGETASVPFNHGVLSEYHDERKNFACHRNEKRLAWVKAKLDAYDAAQRTKEIDHEHED